MLNVFLDLNLLPLYPIGIWVHFYLVLEGFYFELLFNFELSPTVLIDAFLDSMGWIRQNRDVPSLFWVDSVALRLEVSKLGLSSGISPDLVEDIVLVLTVPEPLSLAVLDAFDLILNTFH